MQERGPACGRPSRRAPGWSALRREVADEGGPVAQRRTVPWAVVGAAARAEQVVARAAREERAAPVEVVARMRGSDLTGDPDRVAVHRCGAVVAPPRARRVAADLCLVAREAVVRVGACATRYVVPLADPGVGVDR